VQDNGLRAPKPEDVDAKGPGTRPDSGHGALDTCDYSSRVGKQRLTVERQLHSSRSTGEQAHPELALQRGRSLGNRLLRHAQLIGRVLQLPELGGSDE
jgi:hypothetical protein